LSLEISKCGILFFNVFFSYFTIFSNFFWQPKELAKQTKSLNEAVFATPCIWPTHVSAVVDSELALHSQTAHQRKPSQAVWRPSSCSHLSIVPPGSVAGWRYARHSLSGLRLGNQPNTQRGLSLVTAVSDKFTKKL